MLAGPDGGTPLTISGPGLETSSSFAPSKVLVATDSALQDVGNMLGHAHGKVPLLISFDIPTKKVRLLPYAGLHKFKPCTVWGTILILTLCGIVQNHCC